MVLDNMQVEARLSQRYNFALQHMSAAIRFDQLCYKAELANANQPYGPFFGEIRSYVTATVLSSVAALEANVNESFADVLDGTITFESIEVQELKDSWSRMERESTLKKYERFLKLVGKKELNQKDSRYQSAKLLIRVRNAFVHYKPKWDSELREFDDIGNQLIGKFELSPFLDESSPVFPMRCMTHGFSQWAVQSGLDFAEWFANSAGISYRFKQLRYQGNFDD